MGVRDWFRNTAKQENAQRKEHELTGKAGEKQRAIEGTEAALRREAEKQRDAELHGDTPAAQQARESKERLQQKDGVLTGEKKALESGAQRQHEKAERVQASIQSASRKLDQATAFRNQPQERALPGSVSERKEQMKEQQQREPETSVPVTDRVKGMPAQAQDDILKVSKRLEEVTQHMQGPAVKPPAPEDEAGSGNWGLLQKESNQDKTQAALSPTDTAKGKTGPETQEHPTEEPSRARPEEKTPANTPAPIRRKGRSLER